MNDTSTVLPTPADFPDEPAWIVSESHGYYSLRRSEFQRYAKFYHTSVRLAFESREFESASAKRIYEEYRQFLQYKLRTDIQQHYDSFMLYLEILVTDKLWEDKFQYKELSEPEVKGIESEANILLRGPIKNIRRELKNMFSCDLFEAEEDFEVVGFFAIVRHLIAHNNAVPNQRFYNRTNSMRSDIRLMKNGRILLEEKDVMSLLRTLDRVINAFDHKITLAAKIQSFDRRGRFYANTRDDWAL